MKCTLKHDINKAYSFFYKKLYGYDKQLSYECLNDFIKRLEQVFSIESLGSTFAYEYFAYQYACIENMRKRGSEDVVKVVWLIGEKAIQRWLKDEYRDYKIKCFLERKEITLPIEYAKASSNDIQISRENDRQRFYGTIEGFELCIELGLYHPKSKSCKHCIWQGDCIG